MSAIIAMLASKAGTYLVGAGVVIAAFVATYVKGRLSGAKLEKANQAAKEAKSRAEEIDRIKRAAGATPSDGVSVDQNNRDNQP